MDYVLKGLVHATRAGLTFLPVRRQFPYMSKSKYFDWIVL